MSLHNRFVLLVVLASLAALAGCGSSTKNAVPPPGGSFSNSNLSGTYVFSITGSDASTGNLLTTAGTFSANGSGGITGGLMDMNDPAFGGAATSLSITGGTYHITQDGRGTATLTAVTPFPTSLVVDFVLNSSSHGLIIEFDGNGTGSGTLDLQNTVTESQIASASFAFNLTGVSVSQFSTVGAFTLDSNGNITTGVEDINNAGSSVGLTGLAITGGSVSLATTPGTAVISNSNGTYHFDVFPVDATHLKFIETDATPVMAGDVYTQSATVPTNNVFSLAGLDSSVGAPFTAAGLLITDGSSAVLSGSAEDINDGGTSMEVPSFTGTFTAVSGGRSVLTLTGFVNGNNLVAGSAQFAMYPSSGGLQLMEIDDGGITVGIAYTQTAGSTVAPSTGYGLNLTGINAGNGSGSFEEDVIAEFTNTSGTFTGLIDYNDLGSLTPDQSLSQTYSADTTIPSRGVIAPGSSGNGYNMVSYTVDGSTTVFVQTDTFQVGLGSFSSQSSTAKSDIARRHLATIEASNMPKGKFRRRASTK